MNIFRNYINNRQLGYLFVLIAVLLYSISDAIMKHYTNVYPVSEVTFLRTVARFCPYIILVLFKNKIKFLSIIKTYFKKLKYGTKGQ